MERRLANLYLFVVATKDFAKASFGENAYLDENGECANRISRLSPNLIDEFRSAFGPCLKLSLHAHLSDRPFRVTSDNAEFVRSYPLERLLFPLDCNAKIKESQASSISL